MKRGLKLGLFLAVVLISLWCVASVSATDYYVNATTGNDSLAGTSPAAAWKTISEINGRGFSPGDNIYFERGEEWREQLTVPSSGSDGSPITFSAYGSGDKPIINGADLITGWEDNGSNIWNASLTTEPRVVVFNGTIGTRVAVDQIDSANEWNWTSNVLRVYSTSDPDTAYTNPGIEASQRTRGIYSEEDKDYITIQNLHFKYATAEAIGIWGFNGNTPLGIIIENCEVQGMGTFGIVVFELKHSIIRNCTVYDTQLEEGIYIDSENEGRTDNVTIENCTIYDNYENGIYVHGTTGNGLGTKNVIVRYNYIYGNGYTGEGNGIQITSVNGTDVYYNLFYDNGLREISIGGSQNIDIYSNSIVNIADSGYGIVSNNGCTIGINIKNNIITTSDNDVTLMKVFNSGNATIDYNCYYSTGNYNNAWHWNGTDYDTFAAWKTASSQDSNSINLDPLFTDAANNNFAIEGSSPCRDVGTNVSLTQDYEGNNIVGNPDIGAYEISGSWYFSSAGDDNNNSGYSTLKPLKTISRLNGLTFDPGDNIYFARGEIWRETLTVPSSGSSGNPITFSAYGSGNKPIINGADLITGWEDNGSNIWNASLTTEPNQIFFNEIRGTEVALAQIDAVNEWNWSNNVLYVYSTSDPDTAYTNPGIESSNRIRCLYIGGKNYITIQNINLKYANLDNLGIDEDSDYATVDGITSEYAYWRGVQISTGSGTITGTIIKNSNISYSGGNGIWAGGNTATTLIQGNTIHHNCQLAIDGSQHIYTAGIKSNGNTCTGLIVENNTVYSEGAGNTGDRGGGIWSDTDVQAPIFRYNKVYDNQFHGIYIELTSNAQVYYNLVWDNDDDGISLRGGTTACNGNHIYNNVVYSNTGSGISVWGDNSTPNCIDDNLIRNNIVTGNTNAGTGKSELRCFWGGENDGTVGSGNVYEYNSFGAEQDYFIFWGAGDLDTYDLWETAYGSSTYSVESDPLFTDAANDNFAIEGTSPCRDVGTNVGLTQDYEGNSLVSNPDIGAYEISGEWYIDATGGDDNANSGYSTLKPLKTISRLNGLTFDPGDNIYFKRGEVWREQLTVSSSGNSTHQITFGAYGSGNLPLVLGSEEVIGESGDWSNTGGNKWERALTTEAESVVFNSTNMGTKDSACDAQYEWNWSGNKLYVYSVGNPTSYYISIEASQRTNSFHVPSSYPNIKFEYLEARYGHTGGFHSNADNVDFEHCVSSYTGHSGFYTWDASDCDIRNCTAHHNGDALGEHGIYWCMENATGGVMEYNTCYSNYNSGLKARAEYEGGGVGLIIRYNVAYDNGLDGIYLAQWMTDCEIYYNLVYNNGQIGINMVNGGTGTGNKIYNNVVYENGQTTFGYGIGANFPSTTVKNNIIVKGGAEEVACLRVDDPNQETITSDYNFFYGSGNLWYWNDTYYSDFSSYKSTSNQDVNSINQDPLFVNASNNDFTLQFTSPAIDAGTNVSLTQDYAGNTVPLGTNPDIGAYEYNDTVAPTIIFSCSPTSVRAGGTITCSCSASDDVDSSPSVNYTVNPSTSSAGTYITTCTALDDFGNSASSNISYTVSSAGGGGGGGSTSNPTQEQLEETYEKILYINWKIQFEFNNENHTITLDDIVNETAIITVSSQNQTFNLTINETKKLNLDDDNYYDLSIKLKDIKSYRADLIVKLIHEEIPEEEKPAAEEEKSIREKINRFIEIMKSYWFWVVVALVIIVIIVIIIIRYKKMHYLGSNYKTTKSYT